MNNEHLQFSLCTLNNEKVQKSAKENDEKIEPAMLNNIVSMSLIIHNLLIQAHHMEITTFLRLTTTRTVWFTPVGRLSVDSPVSTMHGSSQEKRMYQMRTCKNI